MIQLPIPDYFHAILHRWWFVLNFTLAGLIIGYAVFMLGKTTYISTAGLLIVTSDISADKKADIDGAINSAVSILSSSKYVQEQAEKLGILKPDSNKPQISGYTLKTLMDNLSVRRENASYVITISYKNTSAEAAFMLTKNLSENASQLLESTVTNQSVSANLFSPASHPEKITDRTLFGSLGPFSLIGFLLGASILAVMRYADKRIYSVKELEYNYELNILGEL